MPATQSSLDTAAAGHVIPSSPAYQALMGQARRLATEFVRQNADGTIDAEIGSHLELALASLVELGASDTQLQRFDTDYRARWPLEPLPAPRATISDALWRRYLGNRRLEPEFRRYFADRVAAEGADSVLRAALPVLVEGIAASAWHALIRTMLGWIRGDAAEIAEGLGYWAATFLRLGRAPGVPALSRRPAELLARLRADPAFRAMDHFGISLWRRTEALGLEPHFAPVIDWLAIDDDTLGLLAHDSLALYLDSNQICALHAVTSCQALRELMPLLSRADQHKAVRHLWQSIAAIYALMGFVVPLTDAEMAARRALPALARDRGGRLRGARRARHQADLGVPPRGAGLRRAALPAGRRPPPEIGLGPTFAESRSVGFENSGRVTRKSAIRRGSARSHLRALPRSL